jgi:hypothetical protein
MSELTRLSQSGLQAARDCKRKYYYRYVLGLQLIGLTVAAMNFGKLWHKVLAWCFRAGPRWRDGVNDFIGQHAGSPDDAHRVWAMVQGYAERWEFAERLMSLHEQPIEVPIRNPATGRTSRRFVQYGFLDKLALHRDGTIWLWEHKTTSQIDGSTIEKLWSDSQITGYVAALRDLGIAIEGVVYDIAKKPALEVGKARPTHELHTGARPVYVVEQKTQWAEFGGTIRWKKKDHPFADPIDETTADAVALGRFYERLTDWHLTTPDAYHREEVYVSDRQIADWREDVWQVTQELLSCRRTGYWYRNTGRCYDYFRACEYSALCQNGASEALINAEFEQRSSPANHHNTEPQQATF